MWVWMLFVFVCRASLKEVLLSPVGDVRGHWRILSVSSAGSLKSPPWKNQGRLSEMIYGLIHCSSTWYNMIYKYMYVYRQLQDGKRKLEQSHCCVHFPYYRKLWLFSACGYFVPARLVDKQPASMTKLANKQPASTTKLANKQPPSMTKLANKQPASMTKLANKQPASMTKLANKQPSSMTKLTLASLIMNQHTAGMRGVARGCGLASLIMNQQLWAWEVWLMGCGLTSLITNQHTVSLGVWLMGCGLVSLIMNQHTVGMRGVAHGVWTDITNNEPAHCEPGGVTHGVWSGITNNEPAHCGPGRCGSWVWSDITNNEPAHCEPERCDSWGVVWHHQ